MHRVIFSVLLIFLCAGTAFAQDWTAAEFKKADTGEFVSYLTDDEKDVIFYMNLIRLDGDKFFNTYIQDYVTAYNESVKRYRNYNQLKITLDNSYYKSLRTHLQRVKNFPLFFPDEKLTRASRNHAIDLKIHNIDTHEGSNGDSFAKRLSKYFPNKVVSENIDFGYNKGLDIVCHLLLDCGVPSLGHRYTILDQKYNLNLVGVNIQSHPSNKYCTVIDFVAQPTYFSNNK
ncbi:CAP domain-containing protein [Pedobacter changchengzhani]|uniref:CAP domain-containing protein n=1 Tax=Pedobacter changchengzhani TaxID=2529274 RepID=A0A4R5MH91_9SPHI|nr:CAP domain-containing protein [Pedobacter changchengzhani]TDG34884.1 CAP domain-containing protein [Pedobacter changchengzhani]